MPLVPLRLLLDHAAENNYGLAAFNVNNMEQVKAILASGRHVVCEKPLAVTSAESAELVELARWAAAGRPAQWTDDAGADAVRDVVSTAIDAGSGWRVWPAAA